MGNVLEQIVFDFQNGKLSHAILLDGGNDTMRLETAQKIAEMLVCSGNQPPCGSCRHCLKAKSGMHPDILHFAGGTTVGSFKVDTVRVIRQNAMVLPNEAAKKVFILEHAEAMAAGAQNALLKILEEPPAYVSFILTCQSYTQLLDTVLSRVSRYALSDDGVDQQVSKQRLQAIEIASEILVAVGEHNEMRIMRQTAALEKDKELFRLCCTEISSLAAAALKAKLTDVSVSETAAHLSMALSREALYAIINIANETAQYIAGNINGNLLLSYFSAQLCAAGNGRT